MEVDEYQDEPMGEEDLMHKASLIYDVFVQNSLEATSHCVEWLPKVQQ
jgi:hypothetical protein